MAALFLTFLAFLTSAAQARTLSSENWQNKIHMIVDYRRPVPSSPSSPQLSPSVHERTTTNYERTRRTPLPLPKLSPPESQLQTLSPSVEGNPCSRTFLTIENGYGKAKISPPPPPASSKSPTQLENVGGNPCSSFLAMETDYGRKKPSTPPPPASSKSPTESEIDSPCVVCSSVPPFIVIKTDYGRERFSPPPPPAAEKSPIQLVGSPSLSPPPPPAPSKSPTHSGNIVSPCVLGTANPCSSFISMVTNQDYGGQKITSANSEGVSAAAL